VKPCNSGKDRSSARECGEQKAVGKLDRKQRREETNDGQKHLKMLTKKQEQGRRYIVTRKPHGYLRWSMPAESRMVRDRGLRKRKRH
jgi:hypothetical protein